MKIKKILYWIVGKEYKEEAPPYPADFAIIEYSPVAKQNGIRTDQNKIIYRYYYDRNGNRIIKKYKYSKQRVASLRDVFNIPVLDKTRKEEILPVFARSLPSEIEYSYR